MLSMLPNLITSIRILGTFCLLFTKPFTVAFYIIYTISGISDLLDGFVARRLKIESELGAKLDSIADLLFYSISTILILPELYRRLPVIIWYFVALIVLLRVFSSLIALLYSLSKASKLRKFQKR